MKLSEKEVQELKEKKVSIEDLYKKYLYTKKDKVNVENILKLLNESICSFEKIVDKFKSIKDEKNKSCLYKLLENKKLFEELIQNNKLNIKDTRYLLNEIETDDELHSLNENTILLKHIVDEDLFKEFLYKHALGHVLTNMHLDTFLEQKRTCACHHCVLKTYPCMKLTNLKVQKIRIIYCDTTKRQRLFVVS